MRYMRIQTYSQLEAYYIYRLLNISEHLNAKVLVWQEVYDNNVPLDENTIIHVWKDDYDRELSEVKFLRLYFNNKTVETKKI